LWFGSGEWGVGVIIYPTSLPTPYLAI
jgi:hypothetical protein